uniref:Ribosome maturation factor RimM n=1 Tax=Lygus hesperus TaxID=30085 RepID=A0A0A9WZQ9_LYGHE
MLRRAVTAAEANVHPLVSWCRTITTDTKVGGGGTLGGCSITLYVYELYSSSGYHTHTHVGSNVGETAKEFELRLKELQVLKASAPIVELPDAEYVCACAPARYYAKVYVRLYTQIPKLALDHQPTDTDVYTDAGVGVGEIVYKATSSFL